ncbi:MAG: hypothetical protein M3Y27_27120 [Acidobacteriota bacterium]|nr:hypothetical protein [Acidobacteriota bacterium]
MNSAPLDSKAPVDYERSLEAVRLLAPISRIARGLPGFGAAKCSEAVQICRLTTSLVYEMIYDGTSGFYSLPGISPHVLSAPSAASLLDAYFHRDAHGGNAS